MMEVFKQNLSRVSVDMPCPQMVMAGYSRSSMGRAVVLTLVMMGSSCQFL